MRVFTILFRKELRSFLLNPLGWIVIAFVIIMHGVSLSTAMKAFSDTPMSTSLVYFSMHTPVFWFYFLFIFPLLTMKLFADEQRSGTIAHRSRENVASSTIKIFRSPHILLPAVDSKLFSISSLPMGHGAAARME